jgi:hypothetical protein
MRELISFGPLMSLFHQNRVLNTSPRRACPPVRPRVLYPQGAGRESKRKLFPVPGLSGHPTRRGAMNKDLRQRAELAGHWLAC